MSVELDENLLDWLVHKGILPSFAFPLDLINFTAVETTPKKDGRGIRSRTMSGFSRGADLALSELAPGNELVVNKHTFRIGGLYRNYWKHPVDRMDGTLDEDNLSPILVYYNRCSKRECRWVSPVNDRIQEINCPICESSENKFKLILIHLFDQQE